MKHEVIQTSAADTRPPFEPATFWSQFRRGNGDGQRRAPALFSWYKYIPEDLQPPEKTPEKNSSSNVSEVCSALKCGYLTARVSREARTLATRLHYFGFSGILNLAARHPGWAVRHRATKQPGVIILLAFL
jgi:hypothetical protein